MTEVRPRGRIHHDIPRPSEKPGFEHPLPTLGAEELFNSLSVPEQAVPSVISVKVGGR